MKHFDDALIHSFAQAKPAVQQPAISRRGFFALTGATGIAALLSANPAVIRRAYADESSQTGFEIYVVKRWEVPVCVYDVSTDTSTPVQGMNVTVTSLYNNETFTAVTDEDGVALIDLRNLSEPDHGDEDLGPSPYQCWASVTIEQNGYRAFEAGQVRLKGAESFGSGTEPDDGTPYIRCLTFDGWDVQYTNPQTFMCSVNNRERHELLVKVANASAATVDMKQGELTQSQTASVSGGLATASFTGPFLSLNEEDASQAFALEKTLSVTVTPSGADAFSVATTAEFMKAYFDDSVTSNSEFTLSHVHPSQSSTVTQPDVFDIPGGIPGIGGNGVKAWIPGIPFVAQLDPSGYFKFGAKFNGSIFRKSNGSPASSGWKTSTLKEAGRRAKDDIGLWYYAALLAKSGGTAKDFFTPSVTEFSSGMNVNVEAGLSGLLEWNKDSSYWAGGGQAYGILAMDASIMEQFIIGYVPVFIKFDFRLALMLFLDMLLKTMENNLSSMELTDGSNVSLETTIDVGVSLGVGMAAGISVSVRGAATLGMRVICPVAPADPSKPYPRFVVFASAYITLAAQIFVAKFSVTLYDNSWPAIYDTWEGEDGLNAANKSVQLPPRPEFMVNTPQGLGYTLSGLGANAAHTSYGRSLGTVASSTFQLVTNTELQQSAEFQANAVAAADANAPAIFEYTPLRETLGNACSFSSVHALSEDGTKPVQTLVQSAVYSDPRVRLITVDGITYLFRLLTVAYPGSDGSTQMRTRLTYAPFVDNVWGAPQVIEFAFESDAAAARVDTYDYDFDLTAKKDGGSWDDGGNLRVFMVSGTRPDGDATTFDQLTQHTVAIFLSLKHDSANAKFDVATKKTYFNWFNADGVMVHPHIVSINGGTGFYSNHKNITCLFALLRQTDSASPTGFKETPMFGIRQSDGQADSTFGDFTQATPYQNAERNLQMLYDMKNSLHFYVREGDFCQGYFAYTTTSDDGPVMKFCDLTYMSSLNFNVEDSRPNGYSAKYVPNWSNGDRLLAVCGGSIKSINQSMGVLSDEQDVALAEDINVSQCVFSDDGMMLYFTTVEDGPIPDYIEEDGTLTPREGKKLYQIWGSVVVQDAEGNYKFTDAFPLAQLDHPADGLSHSGMNNAYGFLFNSITDMANSTSDLYFTAVPYITHVDVTGLTSVNEFVVAGETEQFLLTAKNTGNVVVSSFTILVGVEGEDPIEVEVSIPAAQTILGVHDIKAVQNQNGETVYEHVADVPTEAGVLLPSKTKTYQIQFTVPEHWHGKTELIVQVKDGSVKASQEPACSVPAHVAENIKHASCLGVAAAEPVKGSIAFADLGASADTLGIQHNPYVSDGGEIPDDKPVNPDQPGGGGEGSEDGGTPGGKPGKPGGGSGAGGQNGTKNGSFAASGDSSGTLAAAALAVALGAGGVAVMAASQDSEPEA